MSIEEKGTTTPAPRSRWLMCSLGIGLALMACASVAQECVVPPAGAIMWLAGERNFDDEVGFYNGRRAGTEITFVDGHVGQAMHFDGVDDRIITDGLLAEMRTHRVAFSYELWAKPAATLGTCPEGNSGTCGIGLRWAIYPENGSNTDPPGVESAGIGIAIGTNGVCVGQHAGFLVSCLARIDTAISDWTHVVVVVENKTPRIYLNGTLVRNGVASNKQFVWASWTNLNYSIIGHYLGDLDEVTVYDRALGGSEIAALFAAGTAGKCRQACPAELANDLWQGALVTSNTPLRSTLPDGMFGGNGGSPEPDATLFGDGQVDGSVHAIAWQTASPVTLGRIVLRAFHDDIGNPFRRMRHLRLQARPIGGAFATIYDSAVVLPYAQGPQSTDLLRCPRVRPVHAQQFRAEFVQEGTNAFSGPRIVEFDALIHDPIFRHDFE